MLSPSSLSIFESIPQFYWIRGGNVDASSIPSINKADKYIATMQKEVKNDFSVFSVMLNNLTSNFNQHSLPLSTMFTMIDSLVHCCTKLLEEARNTNAIAVFQAEGKDNCIYDQANSTIPSVYPPSSC
mmetsp:Transcript_7382/g.15826  ORF Transcript_7382/g.15826 Transcript_7382/m.15826 type:complete len:128 (-) Transcript_7382:89-472(-)